MKRNFPLFQSHLDLAHTYWEQILKEGDWAIDATCGNGNDTLKLAQILSPIDGGVIALDIQEAAVNQTKTLLLDTLSPDVFKKINIYQQSHETFPQLAFEVPIKLIVYNLGYLPKGDKQLTTMTSTTLESVENALDLVVAGGVVSITCYPGHTEGAEEEGALFELVKRLSPLKWNICHHRFLNRMASPSLILIQKNN